MPRFPDWFRKSIWVASAVIGLTLIIFSYVHYLASWEQLDNMIVLSLIIAIFPPAIVDYIEFRWRRSADEHLPYLLRDIAEGQRTGMTLLRALEEAAKRKYGPLTKELRKMITQISWGKDFNDALDNFARRIGTPLAARTVLLIKETARTGGNVAEIMDLASGYVRGMQLIEQEKISELRVYMFIIYATYFVFLFAAIMLLTSFFFPMAETAVGQVSIIKATITPREARRLFFHMAIIQAFLTGITAGKLSEGKASAGLKHSAILLTAGLLTFNWFVPMVT